VVNRLTGTLTRKELIVIENPDLNLLVYNALSFGTAVMLGAFVYFLTQISSVSKKYRSSVAASAVVVGIAGYHYYRIWSGWSAGELNEGYRYADWLITVPLLIVELLIVLGTSAERRKSLMMTLVPATALMIGLGYPGEVSTDDGTKWLFWVLAMLPFVYILYVLVNELKQVKSRENAAIAGLITYLFPVFFEYPHDGAETARQLGYTIADITAKAGYGLAILAIAKARSASEPN
jgi:bacteriorhodopsin